MSQLHLMVRCEPEEPVNPAFVAMLCRVLREETERILWYHKTRYGIVVDVIEPRKLIDGCSVYAP